MFTGCVRLAVRAKVVKVKNYWLGLGLALLAVAEAYRPLVLGMPLISYGLNADSGR